MQYKISYDREFDELMDRLRNKYPSEMFNLEGIGEQTDMHVFAKKFFKAMTTADASVDSNANVDARDIVGYQFELPKPFFRMNSYFLLWEKLKDLFDMGTANRIIERQFSGKYYINDFGDIGRPYCFNFSCYDVLLLGLPMVRKIKSIPPKYLYSFISQVENFIILAANSTLGATGLADLLICMSWYVQKILSQHSDNHRPFKDGHFSLSTTKDVWNYVREQLVSFIYTINQPMRGNQSPFINVSVFDSYFLDKLLSNYVFPDGSKPIKAYVMKLQEIFLDVMNKEMDRTPVTFPITTACFSVDRHNELQDKNFARVITKYNLKHGFINIYCGKTSTLSSCCRLRSDTDNEYFNAFGSGSTKIGSLGVVTVNLPRLAWEARRLGNKNQNTVWGITGNTSYFFELLKQSITDVGKINHAKRMIIQSRIDKNLMPLYNHGFMDLKRQYSTYGITGLYECLEILGHNIKNEIGQEFAIKIMDTINGGNDFLTKKFKAPHNCEQTPAENSSIKLAKKDFILGYNKKSAVPIYPFYSNQFIPLTVNGDVLDRIELQGRFDKHFSGGAICHLNFGMPIQDPQWMINLIEYCAKKGVVYWAINYVLQECEEGHYVSGCSDVCQICAGKIINQFTRVVGFLTNTKNWNKVRREHDFPKRKFY